MFRNLSPHFLGLLGCRDHELIELALTHRFSGIELNLPRFQEQVQAKGMASARRYLQGAPLKMTTAQLPLSLAGSDAEFANELARLPGVLEIAQAMDCRVLYLSLTEPSELRPYHENFELHRRRVMQVAERMAADQFRLGLSFSAVRSESAGPSPPFLDTVEGLMALVKTVVAPNLCVIVDTWQWRLGKGTLAQIRELGPDRIGDVRLADLPGDWSLETVRSEDRYLPGSTGVVDNVETLKLLSDLHYAGPITPAPHRNQISAASREEAVERASQSLDKLFESAGIPGHGARSARLDTVGSSS